VLPFLLGRKQAGGLIGNIEDNSELRMANSELTEDDYSLFSSFLIYNYSDDKEGT
jgi:hypothetical protein